MSKAFDSVHDHHQMILALQRRGHRPPASSRGPSQANRALLLVLAAVSIGVLLLTQLPHSPVPPPAVTTPAPRTEVSVQERLLPVPPSGGGVHCTVYIAQPGSTYLEAAQFFKNTGELRGVADKLESLNQLQNGHSDLLVGDHIVACLP